MDKFDSKKGSSDRDDSRNRNEEAPGSRFMKDKRPRVSRATPPEKTGSPHGEEKRRSYNPNFTPDNRVKDGRRQYGNEKPYRQSGGDKPYRRDDSGKPYHKPGEERPYRQDSNDKPYRQSGGDRPYRPGGGSYDNRGAGRPYDNKGGRPHDNRGGSGSREGGRPYDNRGGNQWNRNAGAPGGHKKFTPKHDPEDYPRFAAPKPTGETRLNKFIANSGVCSRREADELIGAGTVTVNGTVVTELGVKIQPGDEVRFNGEIIRGEPKVYILMNKPKGFVTTMDDPHAEKKVIDLVKNICKERVYPVGRLDKNSLGVLLLTNDGELTKKLTHPSHNKKKIYQVTLDKPLTKADMDTLVSGVDLEDGTMAADEVGYVGENKREVGIEIHSGRNRIVRRMFEALGYNVLKLDRVYFAGLTKKRLKRGAWRFLAPIEVGRLKSGDYE